MSITDELRGYAFIITEEGSSMLRRLTDIADRIDAEHQKALDEWKAKHGQMWLKGYAECHAELLEGNETLASDLESCGWIRLPKDADGEVIHVGDVMEYGQVRGRVIALMLSNYPKKWGGGLHWGIQLEGEHAPTALDSLFHHYNPPTVEGLLSDFARLYDSIGGRENEDELWETLLAEYAAKLQLRGEGERRKEES